MTNKIESRVRVKRARLSIFGFLAALPPAALMLTFIGMPILLAFALSIGYTGGLNRIISLIGQQIHKKTNFWGTLSAYKDVYHDPRFAGDLRTTLIVTIVSTLLVLILALGIGLYQRLVGGKLATVVTALSIIPLFVPVVISAWSINTFYSGNGFIRSLFSQFGINVIALNSSMAAIIIGSVWTSLPFAILMVTSGLQSVPDALIEVARDSGAGNIRVITEILIKLAFIPIVIAGTFTSIGIIGSFTIPYFLGPNQPTMLGVEISNFFNSYNRPQQAIVMAFIIFSAASGIALIYIWANIRSAKRSGQL